MSQREKNACIFFFMCLKFLKRYLHTSKIKISLAEIGWI